MQLEISLTGVPARSTLSAEDAGLVPTFERFVRAWRVGFFGPVWPSEDAGSDVRGTVTRALLRGPSPMSAVVVLGGMLVATEAERPGGSLLVNGGVWVDPGPVEVQKSIRDLGTGLVPIDQSLRSIDLREPFDIALMLSKSERADVRQQLADGFDLWAALLTGGLPARGLCAGQSAIGRSVGAFCEPHVFQFSTDGVSADAVALQMLSSFLAELRRREHVAFDVFR